MQVSLDRDRFTGLRASYDAVKAALWLIYLLHAADDLLFDESLVRDQGICAIAGLSGAFDEFLRGTTAHTDAADADVRGWALHVLLYKVDYTTRVANATIREHENLSGQLEIRRRLAEDMLQWRVYFSATELPVTLMVLVHIVECVMQVLRVVVDGLREGAFEARAELNDIELASLGKRVQEQFKSFLSQLDGIITPVHGAGKVNQEDELGRVEVIVVLIGHRLVAGEVLRLGRQLFDDGGLDTLMLLL